MIIRFSTIILVSSITIMALSIGAVSNAETAEEKGLRIAKSASSTERSYNDIVVFGEMILRSKGGQIGTRKFDYKTVSNKQKNSTKSLLIFRWPGDIRNTALLTHSNPSRKDDQWLYLPAVDRVRRISSSGQSGSFVGSEFAYEDMVDQGVEKFTHRWIKDEPCPTGGQCHVLDRIPTSGSGYSSQRAWLDKSKLRVQQVQYFDRRKAHLKTLRLKEYRLYEGRYWRASVMEMKNHLTKKSTVLIWDKFKFDTGLSENGFSVNALKRLR